LVTSDYEYLRVLFDQGAVFARPEVWSIRDAIVAMFDRHDELAAGALELRDKRRSEWKTRMWELEELVFPGHDARQEAQS
jgi:hypothetical protein